MVLLKAPCYGHIDEITNSINRWFYYFKFSIKELLEGLYEYFIELGEIVFGVNDLVSVPNWTNIFIDDFYDIIGWLGNLAVHYSEIYSIYWWCYSSIIVRQIFQNITNLSSKVYLIKYFLYTYFYFINYVIYGTSVIGIGLVLFFFFRHGIYYLKKIWGRNFFYFFYNLFHEFEVDLKLFKFEYIITAIEYIYLSKFAMWWQYMTNNLNLFIINSNFWIIQFIRYVYDNLVFLSGEFYKYKFDLFWGMQEVFWFLNYYFSYYFYHINFVYLYDTLRLWYNYYYFSYDMGRSFVYLVELTKSWKKFIDYYGSFWYWIPEWYGEFIFEWLRYRKLNYLKSYIYHYGSELYYIVDSIIKFKVWSFWWLRINDKWYINDRYMKVMYLIVNLWYRIYKEIYMFYYDFLYYFLVKNKKYSYKKIKDFYLNSIQITGII